jgi:hypothetical protein
MKMEYPAMVRIRKYTLALALTMSIAACGENAGPTTPSDTGAADKGNSEYKIGERLPPAPSAVAPVAADKAVSFRETTWEELIPKDWDPAAPFKNLKLETLDDSDPRAAEALELLRTTWDNAPTAPEMNGAAIRIPGFIVPLERDGEAVRELLLVPYFGACVHVPPPPANQIIHVLVDPPLADARTMDTVWVSGTLDIARSPTSLGVSGYRMTATKVVPYVAPER